jgi:hypothetical protein
MIISKYDFRGDEMEELKTTEAQRKAIRDYEKRNYRLNIVFPNGKE